MSLPLLFFPLVILSLGLFVVDLLWPKDDRDSPFSLLRLALSFGIGFASLSFLMLGWLLTVGRLTPAFNLLMWATLLLPLLTLWRRSVSKPGLGSATTASGNREFSQIARAYFSLALILSLVAFVFYFLKNPHGNWDAWSHWNLRARFIFWGGEKWANALHPDYWNPLNYPLNWPMVAGAGWGFVGAESRWVVGLMAIFFALGCVLLLAAALGRLRGKTQGYLAGILLMGTPYFLKHGISQYSDIPLGFSFLAAFAMTALGDSEERHSRRFWVLAGVFAGLAAWTKNEGLLFIGCFFAARLGTTLLFRGWRQAGRQLLALSLGLAPVLAVVFYVKTQLYAPQSILETRGIPWNFGNLTNLPRYQIIAQAYWTNFRQFGHWPLSLTALLFFYSFWMGIGQDRRARQSGTATLLTIFLMLCGYFGVYLSTPHNLNWHIATSIDRLFLCLWPSFLLGYFLIVKTPEEVIHASPVAQPAT